MIVRKFILWSENASASARADGVSALARAYLYSDMEAEERAEAEQALHAMLDDPSPLVRRALAESFAGAADAPPAIVVGLALDQSDIASVVLTRSPLFTDAQLLDCAAIGDAVAQAAIALRPELSPSVCAALAEIAPREALIALAVNEGANLPEFAMRRMIERFGDERRIARGPARTRLDPRLGARRDRRGGGGSARPACDRAQLDFARPLGARRQGFARTRRHDHRRRMRRLFRGNGGARGLSSRLGPAHRQPHFARSAVRAERPVRRDAGRTYRRGAAPGRGNHPRAGLDRLRRALRKGWPARADAGRLPRRIDRSHPFDRSRLWRARRAGGCGRGRRLAPAAGPGGAGRVRGGARREARPC